MFKSALIAVALAAGSFTTPAFAYCSEPSAPSCANGYGSFDDEWAFNSCKRDMENYKSEVESFMQCKQGEVDEANEVARRAAREAEDVASSARRDVDQVTSDYNDAVNDFNRRAGG